jgi:predicted dehydrogenase
MALDAPDTPPSPSPSAAEPIRWGIIGAANIARALFLPSLREAGEGRAVLVGSRDRDRGNAFAAEHGVEAATTSYEEVLDPERVDAVYIALPNSLHGQWTKAALEAGIPVLCEKPLCAVLQETESVLASARAHPDVPLWEAFAFPFHAQHQRLLALIADGAIGDIAEIESAFHFRLSNPANIRFSSELGGGALADVGCYPIRFAHEVLGPADGPVSVFARTQGEVDVDTSALVAHGERRLALTCGFERAFDTFTRVLGTEGTIQLTNPFHPDPDDTLTVLRAGEAPVTERPTTDANSFAAILRHIHAVIRGQEPPRHLAVDSAAATARTLAGLQALAR